MYFFVVFFFFFFKQKTAYEIMPSLVGSEMCIRDRGRLGDVLTLLHPPYTAWHLSYFALGAAAAPHLHVDRLLWGLAAFGLAVGIAAHALDELQDRPLRTGLSDRALVAMAVTSLLGALAIGVGGIVTVTAWLTP